MSTARHGVGHKHFARSPSSLVAVRRANFPYTLEHDAKLPRRGIMPILKRAFRHFKNSNTGGCKCFAKSEFISPGIGGACRYWNINLVESRTAACRREKSCYFHLFSSI